MARGRRWTARETAVNRAAAFVWLPCLCRLLALGPPFDLHRETMKFAAASAVLVLAAVQMGCFAMQKDHDAVATQAVTAEKQAAQARAEVTALRADLEATRQRLDNALRANADSSSDLQTSKARTNELAGKVDEASHNL